MKKLILSALVLVSMPVLADQYVHGYTRSNGSYVAPHHRSDANNTTYDNWSTKGNTNPYTGQAGYKNPSDTNTGYSNRTNAGMYSGNEQKQSDCVGYGCN